MRLRSCRLQKRRIVLLEDLEDEDALVALQLLVLESDKLVQYRQVLATFIQAVFEPGFLQASQDALTEIFDFLVVGNEVLVVAVKFLDELDAEPGNLLG